MTEPWIFTIQSNVNEPVDQTTEGWDTSIALMDRKQWYTQIDGNETLVVEPFLRSMRRLFEGQAANLGRRLHHAEVIISGEREVLRDKALAHDCPTCQASCDRIMAYMDDHPQAEFIIGTLFWTAK